MNARLLAAAAVLGLSASAFAVTVDGSTVGDGYSLRATQTVQTGFGDNASELNAAYARVEGGRLYVALTGNIEGNFNKLNVFIHTGAAGGENVITASSGSGGNNTGDDGWADKYAGFTFDSNFSANYMLIFRRGNDFGADKFDVNIAQVGTTNSWGFTDVFGGTQEGSVSGLTGGVAANGLDVAYNNANVAGIGGDGSSAADPVAAQAVTTGLEFSIALADLGSPNIGDIKISAMVNGGSHDYLSNQFLGGLPAPQGNLGGDGAGGYNGTVGDIDLNNYAGDQWFDVPTPGAVTLLGLAGLAGIRRRR
ncbi:MAG: hypothetical protein KDA21_01525 [Phycisphaerales bacterium]|nr:hypothetical protein [Phycisphaerales bacterium]